MTPILRRCAMGAVLGAAALFAGGCAFQKTVYNPHLRDLDPSWVVIGETTWEDVLDRWGPPVPPTDQLLTSSLPTLRYFRYPVTVTNNFMVIIPPSYVVLPWAWQDEQRVRDVFIEFDGDGVASDCYVRTEDTIWRPFESEAGREPGVTTFPVKGGGR